jgi:DNA-binding GntR family transcriptional regulator
MNFHFIKGAFCMPIPKKMKTPTRYTAKMLALTQLQQWIIVGTLEPGEKVNDAELAEAIGVSRTPIREALQILELQGFVEMYPGKETIISPISVEAVKQIYPLMASLEVLALETAMEYIHEKELEQIIEVNERFKEALEENCTEKVIEYDFEFHQHITQAAHNTYINSFIDTLRLHISRMEYIFFKDYKYGMVSYTEHLAIIEALKEQDKEKAIELLRANWLRPMEDIIRKVKN